MNSWEALAEIAKDHSAELLVLVLSCIAVLTFLIIVPQVLRAHMRRDELLHQAQLKALDKGIPFPVDDYRARMAGRTALWVPIVVMLATGAVTGLLVVHHPDNLFAVTLAIWVVAGVVSTAAITGGVALIGRLAQLQSGRPEEEELEEEKNNYVD